MSAAAAAKGQGLYKIMMAILLISGAPAASDKLSPNQKAPPNARSAAGRSLALPTGGQTPAHVGRLPPSQAKPSGGSAPAQSIPEEDGIQKSQSVSIKEVNGEAVLAVVGDYAYQSPEGLPVSFKYSADDNGNQASFSIGTAAGGGSGLGTSSGSQKTSSAKNKGAGADTGPGSVGSRGGAGAGGKGSGSSDRTYLPPN